MLRLFFLRTIDIYIGKLFTFLLFLRKDKKSSYKPNYKKILLIKLWGLGNLTIIWPLVIKIKEKYPTAFIYLITLELNKEFIERNKWIDRVIYFKLTFNILKIAIEAIALLKVLRKEKVDLVINFETFNNASALFSYLTNAALRIGLNNKFEKKFYNHWVDNNSSLHISEIFNSLLKPIHIESSYKYFHFSETEEESKKIDEILKKYYIKKFICIHPGCSRNFIGKRWSRDNFSTLSNILIEKCKLPIIFIGTTEESKLVRSILDKIRSKDKVFNLTGILNIWEVIGLFKKSSLVICNDSGHAHIAASSDVNIVVLYGPTSPYRYRSLNQNSIFFYRNLECSPCVGIDYINKKCNNKYTCLNFSPQKVFDKISEKFFNAQYQPN